MSVKTTLNLRAWVCYG